MATVTKDFRIKSGLVVEGANATVNSSDIITEDIITGGTQTNIAVTYDAQNKVINFVAENGIAGSTTNDLVEGTGVNANLYFTDERAQDAVAAALAAGTHTNITVDYDDMDNSISLTGAITYTDEDARAAVSAVSPINYSSSTGEIGLNIGTGLKESSGGNLEIDRSTVDTWYDSNGAAATALDNATDYVDLAILDVIATIPETTDDLPEGTTNKYWLESRSRGAISGGEGIDYSSSTGVISADLGYGLEFDGNGQISIDDTIVATDSNVSLAVGTHSDLVTGVHGVSGDVVGTTDIQTIENKVIGSGTTLSADIDTLGYKITGLGVPTQATDAATKQYVDNVAEGLNVHEAAQAIATTSLEIITGDTVVYNNGTSGVGATLTLSTGLASGDIDGDNDITTGDRIIIAGQANSAHNGIYILTSSTVLTRADDFDTPAEMGGGDFIFVTHGAVYANTGWVMTEAVSTVGMSDVPFLQFSGVGTYVAGTGLILNGTEFYVDTNIISTVSNVTSVVGSHSILTTGVHGVSGNVVGTSGSQTLISKTLGTGTSLSANLDAANSYKVVNLADPTSNQDASTKKYVDDELDSYLNSTQGNEGTTILYVQDYVETAIASGDPAATPTYLALDINSIAKQIATQATGTGTVSVHSFSPADYRSAKYLVKIAHSTHTQLSEVMITLDVSNNIAITEYAVVGTNGSLGDITAEHTGTSPGTVTLSVENLSAGSTVITYGTLLV